MFLDMGREISKLKGWGMEDKLRKKTEIKEKLLQGKAVRRAVTTEDIHSLDFTVRLRNP